MRHFYVGLLAPTGSVLDSRDDKDSDLAGLSFGDLTKKHEEFERMVKAEEASKAEEARKAGVIWVQDPTKEPYKTRDRLGRVISAWEIRSRELAELHFFWWAGLICAAVGVACFGLHRWLAAAILACGFVLMIHWISAPVRLLGGSPEVEGMVLWKLGYAAATLVFLAITWLYLERAR